MLPWLRPPPIFVLNVVFGKLVPNPSCVPNLKLLASMVAKIHRGPTFFSDAPLSPLAQTPANFGPKRRFFGKLVPNPMCVPNLKLVASTVAKIRTGSVRDATLAQTPANFGPSCCFLVS